MDEINEDDFHTFKNNFEQCNHKEQIEWIQKLPSLAKLLGCDRTRSELFPFVLERMDDQDDTLVEFTTQLVELIEMVGGLEKNQITFTEVTQKILGIDEPLVRNKIIEVLQNLTETVSNDEFNNVLFPLFELLSNSQWFSNQCSAAALIPIFYQRADDEQKSKLRTFLKILLEIDNTIVRKATVLALTNLIKNVDIDLIKNEYIPVAVQLGNDSMDNINVLAVDLAILIFEKIEEEDIEEFFTQTFSKWVVGKYFRTRLQMAHKLEAIQTVIPYENFIPRIFRLFSQLLRDNESEVKIMASKILYTYCEIVYKIYNDPEKFKTFFEKNIVNVIYLTIDSGDVLEIEALAHNILLFATILDSDTFQEYLVPKIIFLLQMHNSQKLSKSIFENLCYLPKNCHLEGLLSAICKGMIRIILSQSPNWRIRRSILVGLKNICEITDLNYFSQNLRLIFGFLIVDPIFAVRRTTITMLPLLLKLYGLEFVRENLLPILFSYSNDLRYLFRYIPLFAIQEIIKPSIHYYDKENRSNELNYLTNLKHLEDSTEKTKTIAKLHKLFLICKSKFDNFKIHENLEDYPEDDIRLYVEDTFDLLKRNNTSCSKNQEGNLEAVLIITFNFCTVLNKLLSDPVENVLIKTQLTIRTILKFLENLENEFSDPEIQEVLRNLPEDIRQNVEAEVLQDLSKEVPEIDKDSIEKEQEEFIDSNSIRRSSLDEDLDLELEEYKEIERNFEDEDNNDENPPTSSLSTLVLNEDDNKTLESAIAFIDIDIKPPSIFE